MSPIEILTKLGRDDVVPVPIGEAPAPPDAASRGWAVPAVRDPASIRWGRAAEIGGFQVLRDAEDARVIAFDGTATEGANLTPIAGGVMLDSRLGEAFAVVEGEGVEHLVVNDAGVVSVFRLEDHAALRLRAAPRPPRALSVELPDVEVAGPPWLTARAEGDVVDALADLGRIARHGPREAVQTLRAWARSLTPADVDLLERWIVAEAEGWHDACDLAIEHPDAPAVRRLVLARDRLASLAAIRSLAGIGSPVHARLVALDDRALDHRLGWPDAAAVGLRGDPALVAAGRFDPRAWWAEYG